LTKVKKKLQVFIAVVVAFIMHYKVQSILK